MKVWIYVEGEADRIALDTLWANWRKSLGGAGWGIQTIPLDNKAKFFRKIGGRVAEKLKNNDDDLVVGLPDLYPNREYVGTGFEHRNIEELKTVQTKLVKEELTRVFGLSPTQIQKVLERFHPSAFKHDMEMLILAAREELCAVLGTRDALGNWRHPVEEQDQTKPPKYIVNELFRTKKGMRYRDTVDARAVLARVTDIRNILYQNREQPQCPLFKHLMDWIADKTGVPAY